MASTPPLVSLVVLAGATLLAGCNEAAKPAAVKPAKTELVAHESELLRITLTADAERRLGLQTVAVNSGAVRRVRIANGEIVTPPLAGGLPTASSADFSLLAANQARADGDVGRTRAEAEVARRAYERAVALVEQEAGSVRARDEATSALGVARANLAAAQAQRALLGPPVGAMGRQSAAWVRVSTIATDLETIDRTAAVTVRGQGGGGPALTARPVNGPPSSNPAAGTIDLYYALTNAGQAFMIGQRVAVELPTRGAAFGLMVPASALLNDIHGGQWVYVRTKPQTYERRRIEVSGLKDGVAQTTRGLTAGAEVVTAGAAELFGAEFGAK